MSDQYKPIHWFFPRERIPPSGTAVTWIDLRGRQVDGEYFGSQIWLHFDGRNTVGMDQVVAWRYRK